MMKNKQARAFPLYSKLTLMGQLISSDMGTAQDKMTQTAGKEPGSTVFIPSRALSAEEHSKAHDLPFPDEREQEKMG